MALLQAEFRGATRRFLPCSGHGLLFLQEKNSKRPHNPLLRAGFAEAEGKFCSKGTATIRLAIAPTRGTDYLILPQCGGFRVVVRPFSAFP